MWDDYTREERQQRKKFVRAWILNPKLLFEKADVDVIKGKTKVKRNGEEWENSPYLKRDYANLVRIIYSELGQAKE
jgi:hypothetical protein